MKIHPNCNASKPGKFCRRLAAACGSRLALCGRLAPVGTARLFVLVSLMDLQAAEVQEQQLASASTQPIVLEEDNAAVSSLTVSGSETNYLRSFKVGLDGLLVTDLNEADLEVVGADQSQVEVVVEWKVSGGTKAQATELLNAHQVTLSREGNQIRIQARMTRHPKWFSMRRHAQLQVRIRVTVPQRFGARLQTSSGDMSVTNLHGQLEAGTASGDLVLTGIQGAVTAHTSSGDLVLTRAQGPVEVQTSSGDVRLTDCPETVKLKTSSGDIVARDLSGPTVHLESSSGDITAELNAQPKSDCSVQASSGDITVHLPANVALNLDAATTSGDIHSSFRVSVEGRQKENALRGPINGGGPVLSLRTSSGDIKVRQR